MNIDTYVRPSLRVAILLALMLAILVSLPGCASMEQWTDDHPQVVPVASVVVLTVGGIALAKGIAHSGRSVVVRVPPGQ